MLKLIGNAPENVVIKAVRPSFANQLKEQSRAQRVNSLKNLVRNASLTTSLYASQAAGAVGTAIQPVTAVTSATAKKAADMTSVAKNTAVDSYNRAASSAYNYIYEEQPPTYLQDEQVPLSEIQEKLTKIDSDIWSVRGHKREQVRRVGWGGAADCAAGCAAVFNH